MSESQYVQSSPSFDMALEPKEDRSTEQLKEVIPASRSQLAIIPNYADELLLWLLRYPVDRNHPRGTTNSIPVYKSGGEVMCVQINEKLPSVLNKLIVEGFLSAPVLDENDQCQGVIDMLDLVWFTVISFGAFRAEQGTDMNDDSQRANYWSKYLEFFRFRDTSIRDIMQRKAIWNKSTSFTSLGLYKGFTTFTAMEFMARVGVHRIPILNKANKVRGILTQSMLISLFNQNLSLFGSMRNISVGNIIPGLVQEVVTVSSNSLAIDAFKLMVQKNITGLPVIDSTGVLVDTITIRDLRGMGSTAAQYERLWSSVKNYKAQVRLDYPTQTPIAPITVLRSDTFETVIRRMNDGNIHRIFIVEMNVHNRPVPYYVITQRDVFRFILFRCGLEPTTIQEL